jgi:hypothetical protein
LRFERAHPALGGVLEIAFFAGYIAADVRRAGRRSDRSIVFGRMGICMRRLLPSAVEIAIFAALAVLCAAIVARFQANTSDLRFAALACPVFLCAAVMGLRKSPVWTRMPAEDVEDDG